jgi:hypothetical protein
MIDAVGKTVLAILFIAWNLVFLLLSQRLNLTWEKAYQSALEPYRNLRVSRSDLVILSGEGGPAGIWKFTALLQTMFTGWMIIVLLDPRPLSEEGALFSGLLSSMLIPLMFIGLMVRDRIDVVSNDGIERAWVMRKKPPIHVPWSSILRVSRCQRSSMHFWQMKVKYQGGTMVLGLINQGDALMVMVRRFIPPGQIDWPMMIIIQKSLDRQAGRR